MTDFDERRQTLHAPPVDQPDREAYARALIDSYARWRANQEVELSESEKALYSQALLAAVGAQTGLFKTRAATPHTGQQRGAGEATAAAMTQRAHRDVAAMIGRLQRSLAEDRYKDRDHDASNDRSRER